MAVSSLRRDVGLREELLRPHFLHNMTYKLPHLPPHASPSPMIYPDNIADDLSSLTASRSSIASLSISQCMDSESDPRGTEVARIDTIDESEWDDQTSEIHIPLEDMHENTVPSLNYAHSDTRDRTEMVITQVIRKRSLMYGFSDDEQSSDEDGDLEHTSSRELVRSKGSDVMLHEKSEKESGTVFEEAMPDQSTLTSTSSNTTIVVSDIDIEVSPEESNEPHHTDVLNEDDPISGHLADALVNIEDIEHDTSDTSDDDTNSPKPVPLVELETDKAPAEQDSEKETPEKHNSDSSSEAIAASDVVLDLDDLTLEVDDDQQFHDGSQDSNQNPDEELSVSTHGSSVKFTASQENLSTTASKRSSETHLNLLSDASLSSVQSAKVTTERSVPVQRQRPVSARIRRPAVTAGKSITHSTSCDQLSSSIPLVSVLAGNRLTYSTPEANDIEKWKAVDSAVSHESLVTSEASHVTSTKEFKPPSGLTMEEKLEYTIEKLNQYHCEHNQMLEEFSIERNKWRMSAIKHEAIIENLEQEKAILSSHLKKLQNRLEVVENAVLELGQYHANIDVSVIQQQKNSVTRQQAMKLQKFFGARPPLLEKFLKDLGYEEYIPRFVNEKIGLMELPHLSEQDLVNLGIPLGPHLRILHGAKKL